MLGVAAVGGCCSFRAIWCANINKSLFVNILVCAELSAPRPWTKSAEALVLLYPSHPQMDLQSWQHIT